MPFVVRVEEIVPERDEFGYEQPGSGDYRPAGGVRVTGGGVQGITDGDGRVELRLDEPGDVTLHRRQRRGPRPLAADPDHACSSRAPPPPPPPPAPFCADDAATTAAAAPATSSRRSRSSRASRRAASSRRGSGPRELCGTAGILGADGVVADGTGILMIKLRLTKRVGAAVLDVEPVEGALPARAPCGAENGFWFRVGDDVDWEYLLPAPLGRGRYVLDADAIDRAGNRLRVRRRGENRVVFRVR